MKEFDPSNYGLSFSFESFKPLGELCLILYGMKANDQNIQALVSKISSEIYTTISNLYNGGYWDDTSEKKNGFNDCIAIFLLVESIAQKRFYFHDEMIEHFKKTPKNGRITIDHFTHELVLDLKEIAFYENRIINLLKAIESRKDLTYSWKYAVTHTIFYASNMGRIKLSWINQYPELLTWMRYGLKDSLMKGELDLSAEITLSLSMLGIHNLNEQRQCIFTLMENIDLEAKPPLILANKYSNKTGFRSYYHLLLISLITINHTNNNQNNELKKSNQKHICLNAGKPIL